MSPILTPVAVYFSEYFKTQLSELDRSISNKKEIKLVQSTGHIYYKIQSTVNGALTVAIEG